MQISYFGHSCFRLKGKRGSVITDPYSSSVGFNLPNTSADIVTISHDHADHNAYGQIKGTARRKQPFLITEPGEYEVGGISVFGVRTFHDEDAGQERGLNTVFTILLDETRICHLGDLGHELTEEQQDEIGSVDVLICPVGGVYTLDPQTAVKVIRSIEPAYIIPMHYKTDRHDQKTFGQLSPVEDFVRAFGQEAARESIIEVNKLKLPEETELVILSESAWNLAVCRPIQKKQNSPS